MQVCPYCRVRVAGAKNCCPLCGGTLSGDPDVAGEVFPELEKPRFSASIILRVLALVGVAYRRDIIQNIGWQVALMPVLSILWDVGMGFQGWSLDFVLPCVCATGVLMMLLLAVLLRLPVQSLAGALGGVCVLGLIPGLLAGLGKLRVLLPSLLCTGLSVVVLAAMLIFHWQTFRGELARRFHL